MNSELNHKINAIFNYGISPTTVNKIEILVLNEKIELLNSIVAKPDFGSGVCVYVNGLGIENTIEDLTQQLNQLKI